MKRLRKCVAGCLPGFWLPRPLPSLMLDVEQEEIWPPFLEIVQIAGV